MHPSEVMPGQQIALAAARIARCRRSFCPQHPCLPARFVAASTGRVRLPSFAPPDVPQPSAGAAPKAHGPVRRQTGCVQAGALPRSYVRHAL
jgi:hypothetical protein